MSGLLNRGGDDEEQDTDEQVEPDDTESDEEIDISGGLAESSDEIDAGSAPDNGGSDGDDGEDSGGSVLSSLPFVGGSSSGDVEVDGSDEPDMEAEDAGYSPEEVLDPEQEDRAEYDDSVDGQVIDDISTLHKDFVAPTEVQFEEPNYAKLGREYVQSFYINEWPQYARPGFLERIFTDSVFNTDVTIHIEPRSRDKAASELEEKIGELRAKLEEEQKNSSVSARDTKRDLQNAEAMYDLVSQGNQTMYDVSMYLNNRADSPEQLFDTLADVKSALEQPPANTDPRVARRRQDKNIVSTSPIGLDEMNKKTPMMGGAVGCMMPFSSATLIEESGVDFGVQPYNGSPVIVDRFDRDTGYNVLTIGNIGSGKSFSTKLNLVRTLMKRPDVDIIMMDPLEGFVGVTEALDGNKIMVGGDVGVNPLELKETPDHVLERAGGDLDPYSAKLNDVMAFFETFFKMRGAKLGDDRGVLERAVQKSYEDRGITREPETHTRQSPTIRDVIANLEYIADNPEEFARTTTEDELGRWRQGASRMLVALQPFMSGGEFENLSRQTKIDIAKSQVTYLDLQQQEGKGGTGLMMQLLFNAVYERAKETQNKVIFVIDEARYIMKDAANLQFLEQAVRHSRHYDLSIQFVTQTVEEFFAQPEAEAIADNCSIKQLCQLPGLDENLAKSHFGLNSDQIEFVRNAMPGDQDRNYSEALLGVEGEGWLPIHIRASPEEAAIVDFDPDEDSREEVFPEYQGGGGEEGSAQVARVQQALSASAKDDSNHQQVGGEASVDEKLQSLDPVPDELSAADREEVLQERKEKLDELDREELIEIIAEGDHSDLAETETSEASTETTKSPESTDSAPAPDPSSTTSRAESDAAETKVYHLRIIAQEHAGEDEMPVLNALEDAFEVVGTDPSIEQLRAGDFDIGFDAIVVTPLPRGEIHDALEDVKQVQDVTVKSITDQVDMNSEAAEMGQGGIDVQELLSRTESKTIDAQEMFEELQEEVEPAESFDEIQEEMEEMDWEFEDEVEYDSLFDEEDLEDELEFEDE